MKIFPKKWIGFPKYLILILFAFFFTNLTPDPQQYLDNKLILNLSLFLRLFSSIFLLWGLGGLIYEIYKYIVNKVFRKTIAIAEKTINKTDIVNQKNITIKPNKYFIYGIYACLILLLSYWIFINSTLYIKYNFEKIFNYFITGDCTSFRNKIVSTNDELLFTSCNKLINDSSINSFEILSISHKVLSNKAYIQVGLSENSQPKNYDSSIKIVMKRDIFTWKIYIDNSESSEKQDIKFTPPSDYIPIKN